MSTQTMAATQTIVRTLAGGGGGKEPPPNSENQSQDPQRIRDTFDIALGRAPRPPGGPGGPNCWSSSVAASARTNSTHSSVRRVYADFELLAGTYIMHTDFSYFFVYFSTCRSYSCTELIPYFVAAALVSRLYKSSHFVARASVDSVTTEVSLLHTSLYSYSTLTVPQRLTYLQVS